jgi:hypothetical protein
MTVKFISHLGTSPDIVIDQMRLTLNEIIAKAHRVKQTTELDAILTKMKELFFKLNMAKLTIDKTILSITGLQGVGKTKILRHLYELDDTLLPSDAGRGEVLPVLFTETKGISFPKYFVRRAIRNHANMFELHDIEVTLSEFNQIAADNEMDELWLEVRLPQRYFNTEISLVLLPGFEKERNQKSQRYLETFLKLSTSVVLVFNHKKLAQLDQQLLIEKIALDYRESAPVFALSFAEELNPEQREHLINDLSRKYNIPFNEADRLVFTGTSEDLKDYPEKIIHAIRQYSLTNASGYAMQMHMLTSLTSELIMLSSSFEEEINSIKADTLKKHLQNEKNSSQLGLYEIRDAFRQYREKVTKEVRNVVNRTLTAHVNECSVQMDESIKSEKYSPLDKFKSAFIKQRTFEEQLLFKNEIKEKWKGKNEVEAERRLINALESFVANETRSLQTQTTQTKLEKPVNPLLAPVNLLEKSNAAVDTNSVIETALTNMDRYMNLGVSDLSITLTRDDLKVLPIVAVGIAQEMVVASLILEHEKFDWLDQDVKNEILDKSNKLIAEFQDLAVSTSTVVKGAAIFFGIDALDGTVNTFGALTGLLTSLGVSSAAAAPIGLLIVGAVGSGLAINKGSERIEKYKFERSQLSKEIFHLFANAQEESIIATINNILDKMEEKLIDTYHARKGTDKNFGLLDELDHRISRLQNLCGEMQELAFRNESYIH